MAKKNAKYRECISVKGAQYLHSLDEKELAQYLTSATNKRSISEEVKKVKRYCHKLIVAGGCEEQEYRFVAGLHYGRRYGGNGMQGIPRHFRGLLCQGITTDIDLANAHPNILLYICTKHNITCPTLEAYVKDRDKYLAEMVEAEPNLTRGEAKEKFLISTNSNRKNYGTKCPFFKQYDNELKRIQGELLLLDDYDYILKHAKRQNLPGSNLNHIICKYENEVLEDMVQYLVDIKGLEVHTLMFDGLMVHGNHYEDAELLLGLEEFLKDKWKWEFKLTFKEHSNMIELPEDFELSNVRCYSEMKNEFEQNHLKVGGLYVKETEEEAIVMKRRELADRYEHLNTLGSKKTESFVELWCKDENIRRKERMNVYPNVDLCPEDCYNLWRPFRCEVIEGEYEADGETLAFFLGHLKRLAGNDEACFEFVKLWIAQMIQHPEVKSVALVFISDEGIGKGLFIEILAKMLGEQKVFQSEDPARDVWGAFNSHMKEAFVVAINEAGRKDALEAEGKIKGIITEPNLVVNEKGVKAYTVRSYHRVIYTTNRDDPVQTSKGDRRHVIMRSSDEKKGDEEYFGRLVAIKNSDRAIRTVYDYFKGMEGVPRKITESIMPMSEYHQQMKELTKDPVDLFLEDLARNRASQCVRMSNVHVYKEYRWFCNENGLKCDYMNTHQLGMKITRKKVPGVWSGRQWKEDGMHMDGKEFDCQIMRKHFNIGVCMVDGGDFKGS